jgi:hypothetical protein
LQAYRLITTPASIEDCVCLPLFYHSAFETGSPAGLAQKRDELRAKGVGVSDIVDYRWAQSIYFKDPNGRNRITATANLEATSKLLGRAHEFLPAPPQPQCTLFTELLL